jgi:signal transduction histidine kinase
MNVLLPLLIITPIMLLLAIGLIVFVVLYQKRVIQHQEQVRKLQVTRQHQVLEATMQAQEEERRRVARDLHDEVGSMLSLVKLNLYQLIGSIKGATDEVRSAEDNIKKLLDEVIGSVRRISHDLIPVVLDKMGLVQALDALRRSVPGSSGVSVRLECNDRSRRLQPKQELILYRIVQELLSNTLKHAHASAITIELLFADTEVTVNYSDNGIGFDYEKLQKETMQEGIGVVNLQSRVDLLRGHMNIQSLAGVGTQVEIRVPVN